MTLPARWASFRNVLGRRRAGAGICTWAFAGRRPIPWPGRSERIASLIGLTNDLWPKVLRIFSKGKPEQRPLMILLQSLHAVPRLFQRGNSKSGRFGPAEGGHDRCVGV